MKSIAVETPERKITNTCFARRHLPPAVTAFYSYALAVSRESRIFYSHCRRDAEEFGVNKDTILSYIGTLEKRGWMERITTGKRLKRNKLTGSYDSIPYRVLTHDEYVVEHPGKCRYPKALHDTDLSEKTGQGSESPVHIFPPTCPDSSSHLSEKTGSPVRKSRTKTVKRDGKERMKRERDAFSPLQNTKSAVEKFAGRLDGAVFAGKELAGLSKLRSEFSDQEIVRAWGEFKETNQGDRPVFLMRNFVNGGCKVVAFRNRKLKAEAERTKRQLEQAKSSAAAAALAEQAEMLSDERSPEEVLKDLGFEAAQPVEEAKSRTASVVH